MARARRDPRAARAALGAAARRAAPLDGGITNRNFRVRFGDARLRRAAARQGHRAARDRPRGRAAGQRGGGRGWGSRRRSPRRVDDCLVTEFVDVPADRRRASCGADAGPVARALRAFHDSGVAAAGALLGARAARRLRARSSRDRGGALPGGYARRAGAGRRGSPQALPLTEPRPVPQRPARRQPDARAGRRARDARRLGVRRDGRPAASTSATSPVNNEFDDAGRRAAADGLLRRAARPTRQRAALALMRLHVRRPRGGLGRRPGRDLRARLRLRRLRATSTSSGCARRRATRDSRSGSMPRPRELPDRARGS